MLIFRAWATCVETSSSPGLTATKSIWRTCRVYHVEFPQILKELEGTIDQFMWSFKFSFLVFVVPKAQIVLPAIINLKGNAKLK